LRLLKLTVPAGQVPVEVTTDRHDAYPRATRETLGAGVTHRRSRYTNNRIEQGHRSIEQHDCPMRGFGSYAAAARFCRAFEEQRRYFRAVARSGEPVSLVSRRNVFGERRATVMAELAAAWSSTRSVPHRPQYPRQYLSSHS